MFEESPVQVQGRARAAVLHGARAGRKARDRSDAWDRQHTRTRLLRHTYTGPSEIGGGRPTASSRSRCGYHVKRGSVEKMAGYTATLEEVRVSGIMRGVDLVYHRVALRGRT